jgi:hypothetical protein
LIESIMSFMSPSRTIGFSGGVVVAQVRSAATDLLRASGVDFAEAPRLVRRAAGWHNRPRVTRRTGRRPPAPGHS